MDEREYTVAELIEALSSMAPRGSKVKLVDVDTSWTVPKFSLKYDVRSDVLWISPCEYSDMTEKASRS